MERKGEENYIKKGEKGLKNASFWVIISKKKSRVWGLLAFTSFWVIKSTNFRPDRRKLIRRKRTKNGNGIKNAAFWAINSTARPPQTYSSEKKNESQKRGGGGMIEMHNIYPWSVYFFSLCYTHCEPFLPPLFIYM